MAALAPARPLNSSPPSTIPPIAQDHASAAGSGGLRLGQVADGPDHVERRDPGAGAPHRHRADHEPDGAPVTRLARLDGQPEDEVWIVGGEDDLVTGDDRPSDSDADDGAGDRRRAPRRSTPSMANARMRWFRLSPIGPHHAELGLALLGEHHEEVDQQQDPGDDAEPADGREQLTDSSRPRPRPRRACPASPVPPRRPSSPATRSLRARRTTASDPSAPSNTPPSFDTKMRVAWAVGRRPRRPVGHERLDGARWDEARCRRRGRPPATTCRTANDRLPPRAKTSIVSPAPTSSSSARRSSMTASSPLGVAPGVGEAGAPGVAAEPSRLVEVAAR